MPFAARATGTRTRSVKSPERGAVHVAANVPSAPTWISGCSSADPIASK